MGDDNGTNTNEDYNNSNSSMMMEMSQDCIVWDESRNIDLRDIARSPLESLGSARTAANRNSTSNTNNNNRLDSIKCSLNRSGASSASRPEQEIDGIFKILEQQEGTSPHPATNQTQPTGNSRRQRFDIPARRPQMTTSLASRKRRKQRQSSNHRSVKPVNSIDDVLKRTGPNARRRRRVTNHEVSFLNPVLDSSGQPTTSMNTDSTDDGAFEELLKEFSIPQSVGRKKQLVPGSESKERSNEHQDNSGLHTAAEVPMRPPVFQISTSPIPPLNTTQPITPPNDANLGLNAPVSNRSNPEVNYKQQQQHHHHHHHSKPPLQTTRNPAPPVVNRYQKILPPKLVNAKENSFASQHFEKSVSQGPPSNLLRPSNRPNYNNNNDNNNNDNDNDKNHRQEAISTSTSSKNPIPAKLSKAVLDKTKPPGVSNGNNNDDEFGDDFDFGEAEIANLDSLLSMKSSTQVLQQTRGEASHPKPTAPTASPKRAVQHQTSTIPPTKKVDEDILPTKATVDEFDDFPEIDFDAIDQVIAQRNIEAPVSAANEIASMACHIPPDGPIRNPRRTVPSDPDLSFIAFTRYKVVDVADDGQSYTKTLAVASWSNEMLKEEEEKQEFHRHCHVTKSNGQDQEMNSVTSTTDGLRKRYAPEGLLHLRGEWYYTPVSPGDVVHLCSISGSFRTDVHSLPIVLHTADIEGNDNDDLVLVTHPDMLMTPTTISETVTCSRRAILKSRIGSTGLTSKSPLFGIMRHDLFGLCIRQENFDQSFAKRNIHKLVRQNAEGLLGCNVSTNEAQEEILKVLPVIQEFVARYTTLGQPPDPNSLANGVRIEGHGYQSSIQFVTHKVHAIEEPIVSPELALKGNIDAVLEANTRELSDKLFQAAQNPAPQHSLMCLELKTGHRQTAQAAHMAQLALYTLMLQSRYGKQVTQSSRPAFPPSDAEPNGASAGGLLLYLNQNGAHSSHISPLLTEVKSLIGQRNIVANGLYTASRPRGVLLSYDDGNRDDKKEMARAKLLPPTPADLPELIKNKRDCQYCYVNRECMLYAAAEVEDPKDPNWEVGRTHGDLVDKFTGNLQESDISYFREWDRLIDLEADASSRNMATAWLTDSRDREREKGESISSLVFDHPEPSPTKEGSHVLIAFRRSESSHSQTSLESMALTRGCQIIISTDGTSLDDCSQSLQSTTGSRRPRKKFRHQMHIVRGYVHGIHAEKIFVLARREDLERIRDLLKRYKIFCSKNDGQEYQLFFRVDKDNSSVGIGTLRQNVINFLTADSARTKTEQLSQASVAKKSRLPKLRDIIIRLDSPHFDLGITPASLFNVFGPSIPGCEMRSLSVEFVRLNPDQQKAIVKVISAYDYTLLQGLPGTGKTTTVAYIARLLAARGKRVLITSYTHAAVDNVVLKLIEKGVSSVDESTPIPALIRIGQRSSCHADVNFLLATELATQFDKIELAGSKGNLPTLSQTESYHNFDNPSVESLKEVVSSARIICASALSVPRSPLLIHESFDVVIIDEAGQISQPAILGALAAADSFVLVGDHKQLPPLVNSELAEAGGYGVSMMERLAKKYPDAIASLTYQYRMNIDICRLSSEAVYGGRMKCGSEEVKSRTLELPGFPINLPQASSKRVFPWLKPVIHPLKKVVFVDTDNVKTNPQPVLAMQSIEPGVQKQMEALEGNVGGRAGRNVINRMEVSLVRMVLGGLFACGVQLSSVGIISPFRAQLRILEEDPNIASWKAGGLELSTIDRFQGRDKEIIILSTVRSNLSGKVGRLLLDMRRLNVALTRAKSKLIIVGSFSTLSKGSDPLRPLLARVNKRGQRLLLPEDAVQCYNL